jgi:succinate-acetate transporter protein
MNGPDSAPNAPPPAKAWSNGEMLAIFVLSALIWPLGIIFALLAIGNPAKRAQAGLCVIAAVIGLLASCAMMANR